MPFWRIDRAASLLRGRVGCLLALWARWRPPHRAELRESSLLRPVLCCEMAGNSPGSLDDFTTYPNEPNARLSQCAGEDVLEPRALVLLDTFLLPGLEACEGPSGL